MPPAISIDTREIDRYLGLLKTEGLAVVEAELRIALDAVLEYLQMLVVDKTPRDNGRLQASIYTEVRGVTVDNRGVAVSGLVSSHDFEPKVTAMEYGRPAGRMPPIEAIALWVKRKDIIDSRSFKSDVAEWKSSVRKSIKSRKKAGKATARLQSQLRVRQSDLIEQRIMQIAFLIARAIAQGRSRHQKKGGDKMFAQAAEKGQAYTDQAFDQALTQILARWAAL